MLVEQELGRQTVGQADPHVERSLARCRELAGDGEYTAASLFVQPHALGHGFLRPGQRRDRGFLQRREDAGAHVILECRHPGDELFVADDEADPPTRHSEALRHREQLDADVARAALGEEALGLASVEDEVAVREVVDHGGARVAGERHGLGEHAGLH